jgi:hypothetical protein
MDNPGPAVPPPPQGAEGVAEAKRLIERLPGSYFDLRYRLYAVGGARLFASSPDKLDAMLNELKAAIDRDEPPRILNRISMRYDATMSFTAPRPNHVLVYSVTIQLDGTPVCALPVEAGMTVAHRRLGDRLLRVKFAPLPKDASKADRDARVELKRRTVMGEDGPLRVAGRIYMHFVHKDAEKTEEQSQLWFIYVKPPKHVTPQKQLRFFWQHLLDAQSWKAGLTKARWPRPS